MKENQAMVSLYLQNIIGGLAIIKQQNAKPFLFFDVEKIAEISFPDYQLGTDRIRKITGIEDANLLFKQLILGEVGEDTNNRVRIMCSIWNLFFGAHYTTWNTDSKEWLIANTWLRWILDYIKIICESDDCVKSYLDCRITNKDNHSEYEYKFLTKDTDITV